MPAGGGDPHIRDIAGNTFEFRGVPGEVYELIRAHNIGLRCTVAPFADGHPGQVIDKLVIHLPGVTVTIDPQYVTIETPDHKVVAKQDPGHTEHEGDVYPDPLKGDFPHIDFLWTPKIPLDREHTAGLLYDGHEHPGDEARYRTGLFWAADSVVAPEDLSGDGAGTDLGAE